MKNPIIVDVTFGSPDIVVSTMMHVTDDAPPVGTIITNLGPVPLEILQYVLDGSSSKLYAKCRLRAKPYPDKEMLRLFQELEWELVEDHPDLL